MLDESNLQILPTSEDGLLIDVKSALPKPNGRQTLRICLNLKKIIDNIITFKKTTSDLNKLAKSKTTIQLALDACGGKGNGEPGTSSYKYRSAIIFCLLVVVNWYNKLMLIDLNSYDVNMSRKSFTELLARHIINHFVSLDDKKAIKKHENYLFINVLCTKFTINLNNVDQIPRNALEVAADLHSIPIITASGFQKCIKYLWRGWIVQSEDDGNYYEIDTNYSSLRFMNHFNPNRLKSPRYQNFFEIFVSVIYLIIFTVIINCEDKAAYLPWEVAFYVISFGFLGDEVIKLYYVGFSYLRFWNYFNDTMYGFISIAFIVRVLLPAKVLQDENSFPIISINEITAFKILSCVAPFMWTRLLFFLDCFEFIGVIIVVIAKMMKESLLFFVLLSIIVLGFLQGFMGLDTSDGEVDMFSKIFHAMTKSIIAGAQFPVFDNLTPPYSVYLYYVFRFLINVMLMKILSALYNNSYKETVGQSSKEYAALFTSKVLRYIRAPDEHVYIPPLNLIELVLIILLWPLQNLQHVLLSQQDVNLVNFYVMQVIYSPFLLLISIIELKQARRIQYNRAKGLSDDSNESDLPWDLTDGFKECANQFDAYTNDNEYYDCTGEVAALSSAGNCLNDEDYNETIIRQGLRLQRLAERQDPEFLVNLNVFNKYLNDPEFKTLIIGGDSTSKVKVSSDKKLAPSAAPAPVSKKIEEDVASLGTQLETLLLYLEKVAKDNDSLLKENENLKADVQKLRLDHEELDKKISCTARATVSGPSAHA